MVAEHVEKLRERNQEFDKKLSPGTYAWKQVSNIIANICGLVGGATLGHFLGKALWQERGLSEKAKTIVRMMGASPATISQMGVKHLTMGAGAFAGWITAITVMGYEHWVKGEAARLSVDEINKDISQAKLRMDPELKRENELLREMLKQQDQVILSQQRYVPKTSVAVGDASLEPLSNASGIHAHEVAH